MTAWTTDTEATHLDALPISQVMPDHVLILSSLVGDALPPWCYLLGLRVAWVARVGDLFQLHDHMGGTWVLHPATTVLRIHA